jgi:hypothetical protein
VMDEAPVGAPALMRRGTRARGSVLPPIRGPGSRRVINRRLVLENDKYDLARYDGRDVSQVGEMAVACRLDAPVQLADVQEMLGLNRSQSAAVIMVASLAVSLVLLMLMPSEPEGATDQIITYSALALYVAALALLGMVIYHRRRKETDGGARADSDGEDGQYEGGISDIEREFEALEKEIEREERG